MVKRSHEEWRGLFEAHAVSVMTERAFCVAWRLCPKHFNLRKKQLGWVGKGSAVSTFVRVEQAPAKEALRVHIGEPQVVLRLGRCEWELRGLSEDGLLQLMKALA